MHSPEHEFGAPKPSNTPTNSRQTRPQHRLRWPEPAWLLVLAGLTCGLALAQGASDTKPMPTPQSQTPEKADPEKNSTDSLQLRYTYGLRLQFSEAGGKTVKAKLKPELGFKYGRWSVGTNADFQTWLDAPLPKRDPSVAYEAIADDRLRVVLGLRLQNLSTGAGFNALESGRLTLRARVLASYQISPEWAVLGEWTQDLQNRGDGSTLSLGASRLWPLGERDQMSVGMILKWASAEHWRTPYLLNPQTPASTVALAQGLNSGLGALGLGWEYRYKLNDHTMLLSGVSASRSIGQMADLNGSKPSFGAQLGILWFGHW